MKRTSLLALTFAATVASSAATEQRDTTESVTQEKKEERNVMLNASDANKPREIQIGLPSEDINVYENGLPAVYSSAVHKLSAHWRSDNSLGEVSLMTPSESAIATGNVAYSVNSNSRWGEKAFHAILSYKANHFGWQNFDMNASGGITDNLLFTASVYQNFDPGSFRLKFTDYADRTQLYHLGLTHLLPNNRGRISLMYKHSRNENPGNFSNAAPFIYKGDGSVEELPGFKLGTSSYVPRNGRFQYMDIITGEMRTWNLGEDTQNMANELTLVADYRFNKGWKGSLSFKWMDAPRAKYVDFGGSSISEVSADDNYMLDDGSTYTGLKEGRRTWLHDGKVRNVLLTTELQKTFRTNTLKLGLNQWHYSLDYHSASMQWDATVEEYPRMLNSTYGYNELSPEYTKGYENKLAIYATDQWQATSRLSIFAGARLEYYRMNADRIPMNRFSGFHIGAVSPADGSTVAIENIVKNKLNYAATLRATYTLSHGFGLTADATIATRFPRINEYAGTGPTEEQYKRVTIPLVRGGLTYRNSWLDLTSMVSYIGKTNNIDQQNLTRPGSTESKTVLLIYGIQTIGWTTSAEITPFKGAHLHALLTIQKPTYKDYNASVTFSDGTAMAVNANGNVVKEIPQTLIELDPSYNITDDLRLWLSFRYFGKTYANLQESLFFNGRWESFGGINWRVNKNLSLNATVINFLNQKGASGTINGSELISKEDAHLFAGHYMSGNYLRPFTLEFGMKLEF
ncbi:TonB-dependent receptor [Palleniella muris]|uniref:TonB-dependent receptor n=1 Tax=Palleniella muris TaxID=3038145 RepID=A0AC61QRT3_9BACT|nr:TonB-dependent receptor [Palleniella muris]TGX83127.1 TonB-dependent receptor [Palleniella muris]